MQKQTKGAHTAERARGESRDAAEEAQQHGAAGKRDGQAASILQCRSNSSGGATPQVRTPGRVGDRIVESGDVKHAYGHVAQIVLAEHLDAESLSVRGGHDGHERLERAVARQALAVCTCSIDGCARLRT